MGTPASPLALLTHCPPLSSRTLHVPLFIPTAVLCCGLQLCTNDAGFPGLSSEPLTTLLSLNLLPKGIQLLVSFTEFSFLGLLSQAPTLPLQMPQNST